MMAESLGFFSAIPSAFTSVFIENVNFYTVSQRDMVTLVHLW